MDKGKAIMSSEMTRREKEEAERKRAIEENISRWWATQQGISFRPPILEEYLNSNPTSFVKIEDTTGPYHHPSPYIEKNKFSSPPGYPIQSAPNLRGSTSKAPPPQTSPTYTPASPRPMLSVVTDWITEEDLHNFWKQKPAPVPPNKGPWYRFEGGYIQFRHGITWAQLNQREKEAARGRELARARGEPVFEPPPTQLPDERIIRVVEVESAPAQEEEEEENDNDDPMEESEETESEENEEDENDNHPDWSDTSTITEERTQVPLSRRRYIRGPRGYANRHR